MNPNPVGCLVESNEGSVNIKMYGNLHNDGHLLLGEGNAIIDFSCALTHSHQKRIPSIRSEKFGLIFVQVI